MKRSRVLLVAAMLLLGLVGVAPTSAGAPAPAGRPGDAADLGPTVYVGRLTPAELTTLGSLGLDREDLTARQTGSKIAVEIVLSRLQAAKLQSQGIPIAEKKVDGATVTQRMTAQAAAGYTVFRSYGGPGGIQDELIGIARQYPRLTKLVSIGRTRAGPGDPGHQAHQGRHPGAGRLPAGRAVLGRPARPGVDHPGDGPAAAALLPRQLLLGLLDPQDRRQHRTVVRTGGQPRRLRLHLHPGKPIVAQEPPGQRR